MSDAAAIFDAADKAASVAIPMEYFLPISVRQRVVRQVLLVTLKALAAGATYDVGEAGMGMTRLDLEKLSAALSVQR